MDRESWMSDEDYEQYCREQDEYHAQLEEYYMENNDDHSE